MDRKGGQKTSYGFQRLPQPVVYDQAGVTHGPPLLHRVRALGAHFRQPSTRCMRQVEAS